MHTLTLLLDAGNTRLKWALADADHLYETGACAYEQLPQWADALRALNKPISQSLGVSVISDAQKADIARHLENIAPAPQWLSPVVKAYGITNHYEQVTRLGADRWASLIGVHARFRTDCLIATVGTATTLDCLRQSGDFEGGFILPGLTLMQNSLPQATAQLPLTQGHYETTPRNTHNAIYSGIIHAQCGAIERTYTQFSPKGDALLILSGGAADILSPHIQLPHQVHQNLPLSGLQQILKEISPTSTQ